MCVVSMITEHYTDKWERLLPRQTGQWNVYWPPPAPSAPPAISPEEVAEFRRLLDRAREYDARNHEPSCESAEKVAAIKAIAKALGVDVSFVSQEAA